MVESSSFANAFFAATTAAPRFLFRWDLIGSDLTSAGDGGRGSAPPPFARPPGPQLRDSAGLEPARVHGGLSLERNCAPLEMLGYHQPRDSHVHG